MNGHHQNGDIFAVANMHTQLRSKFADGQHAEIMEVLRLGELEVERSMANPFRRFTALLTEVRKKTNEMRVLAI